MQKINLEVTPRDLNAEDKKNPNQLRREGQIPAVLYGHGQPVTPFLLTRKNLEKPFTPKPAPTRCSQ
jgi:ribosomal protein L25 (general stress protein Ctc)